ncbi:dTDP-4-amino-4,6-dideoxygalactose transaminase [Virgibacillus natechei]|uniref:dTDP-4-amino-4,6-dideoxygalactose transaminase n=1 Tax=Virgibacillus natechei TaxID=1216297 RepID=A0ABS4IBY2_9BACI|nr:DegT/DnrJ/EryC1/StrS family aminotransferase [Virgibacillus natechei]MBP1968448.1 dTDP-4-amino-4,6-dideoxygalactose transaminase [Virgibacillus natechei]UZD13569.1 DegT/DnrJ/EryC1/StrS family aminotransferase [Virgibacillus natechei]
MSNNTFNQIPMVDLKEELTLIRTPILEMVTEVLNSGEYILGEKGEKLEKLVAEYVEASYGIGVANGTDALQLSLMALDIGPGDDVITTPFTFFATGETIAQVGAQPIFVDIEEANYNMDPSKIEEAITQNTKAIIIVHLNGKSANMKEIMAIANKYNLRVIEDACQAIGTEYDGSRVGAIGDIGCFSFFPSKNLGAFGDAGLVTTNHKALYEKISQLRNHGSEKKYQHSSIGMNSRLDELQAAILLVKLYYLDIFLHKRKEVARRYTEKLNNLLKKPPISENREHTFHQYCIELDKRDELVSELKNNGIASAIYYPIPLHLQQAFHYLHYKKGDFPIAEKTAEKILALPISPTLSFQKQDYIISTVNKFLENNG